MNKSQHEIASKLVIKTHCNKRNTYWCAPRRVKSTDVAGNIDSSLIEKKKLKKGHRKKKRKSVKKLRRIDILAQPKSVKQKTEYKDHFSNVSKPTRKYKIPKTSISSSQRSTTFKIKRFKEARELSMNTSKDCAPIMLPKKLGVRLSALGSYLYF
ncbi:hypothetical protein K0M31_018464 [Melipona bicolor]|uniref:Uncharacterized protein n=1 Tax=Melipona bicolor TaxID=60889 RepID=A0AA40KRQ4_9HYME|nr:hypothetical protein K0M31_018464 [Melipona bicolor]